MTKDEWRTCGLALALGAPLIFAAAAAVTWAAMQITAPCLCVALGFGAAALIVRGR